jgi:sugar/nucleoside kinase (ribokinase family)
VATRVRSDLGDRPVDLLVVGEINPDVIVTDPDLRPVFGQAETLVRDIRLCPGSSSVITACGASRLGLRTAFAGVVGDDLFGRYMLATMVERGIDTSGCVLDTARPTGVSVVLNRGDDRATLTALGTIGVLRVDQVPVDLLTRTRHVHVGSYFLQAAARPELPAFLAEARAAGATTSFDCNWDPANRWDGIDHMLGVTDIFFLNQTEAGRITGLDSAEQAAAALVQRAGPRPDGFLLVVVKQGAEGALLASNGELTRAPARTMPVVDTTGAGDSFNAGFLYGWVAGWDLARCLRLGVACGSLSTSKVGGVEAQPGLAEALAWLSPE